MNLRTLAGDRRVQLAGAGVAALAGAFVWYRHRGTSTSGTTAADGSGTDTPTATVQGSFPDTSGTDIASWLTQNEAAFMTELDQALAQQQQTAPAPVTPSPAPYHHLIPPSRPGVPERYQTTPGGIARPVETLRAAGTSIASKIKS